jgi:hypothetical protein
MRGWEGREEGEGIPCISKIQYNVHWRGTHTIVTSACFAEGVSKIPIRNVRRYSPTLYTAARCTPRSQEAQSKYTESEKEKNNCKKIR